MSQKVSRKTINEEKDKRSTNSPVKEMKKKMAANAEKEKQAAAEKADKVEKTPEKSAEKPTEKTDKTVKLDNSADKKSEKKDNAEKKKDTADKKKDNAEKKTEPKQSEPQAEKSKEESSSKEDKSGKAEKEKPDSKKSEPSKQKQNGRDRVHNEVSDVTLGNGTDDVLNGTVKAARTPETPRPAERDRDAPPPEPKDSKVLKLKDDAPATDRKLRSADSPKPETKKQDSDKKQESEKKDSDNKEKETDKQTSKDVVGDKNTEESKSQEEKVEIEVVIEVESNDGEEPPRKTDTNYSKSRVKVSPYRRSGRLADQTNSSLVANYTGNNTTMEMDITESSSFMDESNLDDSSYLRGLRSIRGRNSYKPLKEITLRHVANRSMRSNTSANCSGAEPSRPTGTVVGRKRKPDAGGEAELGAGAGAGAGCKRLRVLERLAEPFRRVASAALPAAHRRNAPIVGINTDLPLTAPVAAAETFDPESLKSTVPAEGPVAVPLPTPHQGTDHSPLAPHQPDNKRCVVM